jgi:hypothetical protein
MSNQKETITGSTFLKMRSGSSSEDECGSIRSFLNEILKTWVQVVINDDNMQHSLWYRSRRRSEVWSATACSDAPV